MTQSEAGLQRAVAVTNRIAEDVRFVETVNQAWSGVWSCRQRGLREVGE